MLPFCLKFSSMRAGMGFAPKPPHGMQPNMLISGKAIMGLPPGIFPSRMKSGTASPLAK